MKSIKQLDDEHPAKQYCLKRKLPSEFFDKLFFASKFGALVNKVKPNTYGEKDHPRLVIPFYDTTGKLFAFQGRAFGNEQPKYLTVKLDENKQKVYGLERINFQRPYLSSQKARLIVYLLIIVLAAAGADLILKNKIKNEEVTYIFDNEPRNKEISKTYV